jgi:hypothetical protein
VSDANAYRIIKKEDETTKVLKEKPDQHLQKCALTP